MTQAGQERMVAHFGQGEPARIGLVPLGAVLAMCRVEKLTRRKWVENLEVSCCPQLGRRTLSSAVSSGSCLLDFLTTHLETCAQGQNLQATQPWEIGMPPTASWAL